MTHVNSGKPAGSNQRSNAPAPTKYPKAGSRVVVAKVEDELSEEVPVEDELAEEIFAEEGISEEVDAELPGREEPIEEDSEVEELPFEELPFDEEPLDEEALDEPAVEDQPGEEDLYPEETADDEPIEEEQSEEELQANVMLEHDQEINTPYGRPNSGAKLPRFLDVTAYLEKRHIPYEIDDFDEGCAYHVTCPFHESGDGVIIQYVTGEIRYCCSAPPCSRRSWRDYRDEVGVPDTNEFLLMNRCEPVISSPDLPPTDEELPFTRLISSQQLGQLRSRPSYLIPEILVEGQPCVLGGRSKAMKTSVAIDLAVSLGSGTDFLGQFPAKKSRVAVWSGESGAATIRDTAWRVAEARQINLEDCSILWSFDLPQICSHFDRRRLAGLIIENSIDVVIIDPLYLAISNLSIASSTSNLFAMGSYLAPLTELIQQTGVTFIVLHHFRKTGQPDASEPASLDELSQAGIAEWMRQWILLQRRSKYQCDGIHELWMRCGGSAGHAGLWAVDVHEGTHSAGCDTGRFWAVNVRTAGQVVAERECAAQHGRMERIQERESADQQRVLEALHQNPAGATRTMLRTSTALSTARLDRAIHLLLAGRTIQETSVQRHTRREPGYSLTAQEGSTTQPRPTMEDAEQH